MAICKDRIRRTNLEDKKKKACSPPCFKADLWWHAARRQGPEGSIAQVSLVWTSLLAEGSVRDVEAHASGRRRVLEGENQPVVVDTGPCPAGRMTTREPY